VASGVAEGTSKNIDSLLERVKANRSDYAAWMQLAVAYREVGDHSHQVWAWSRAIKHSSKNRHCKKWGHLLRFNETPDQATCLYCGESFVLGAP
jgi:Tfp pilus assembly protein PilF